MLHCKHDQPSQILHANIPLEIDQEIETSGLAIEKSLLNQSYPLEEAFAKGGNSDKVKLIPSHAVIISEPLLEGKVQAHGYCMTFILSTLYCSSNPNFCTNIHLGFDSKISSIWRFSLCYCHLYTHVVQSTSINLPS